MYTHPQQGMGQKAVELRREAGAWLKQLRQDRNLSQRDLAKLVNVEYYTFISQIEAGKGRIPPDRYAIWADALGVEVRAFVKTLLKFYDPITYDLLFSEPAKKVEAEDSGSEGVVVRLV